LKLEINLLFSVNKKSNTYTTCQFIQQRMTVTGLEWPFHASRAISAVA